MPLSRRVSWPHVALGVLLAAVAAALAGEAIPFTVLGVAAGGFLAARLAKSAGVLQGAAVAILWILLATLQGLPSLPADALGVMGFDVLHLAAGAGGGWLATRT